MATLASLLVRVGVRIDGALKVQSNVKKIEKSTKEMAREADRSSSKMSRAFRSIGDATAKAGTKLNKFAKSMGGLHKVAMAGAAALAGAATAVGGFVVRQTAAIDETNKLATALGLGVEELQRLQFAAGQSGLSSERLNAGIKRLNQGLLQIAEGAGGQTGAALDAIGVSLDQLDGLSTTQKIGLIGEALQSIEDPAQRSARAAQIFGEEAGPSMASLLALGQQGLEELARSTKGVLTQEDADRASAFQDRMGALNREVSAFGQVIAVELIPILTDVIIQVREWMGANDEVIKQDFGAFVSLVADEFRALFSAVDSVVGVVRSVASGFDEVAAAVTPAGVGLENLGNTFYAMVNPIRGVVKAINLVKQSLIDIGAISAPPIADTIAETAKAQIAAVEGATGGGGGGGVMPAFVGPPTSGMGPAAAPRRGGGGGGGGGRRSAGGGGRGIVGRLFDTAGQWFDRMREASKEQSGLTVQEAVDGLISGNPEVLQQRLKGMASRTPDASSIRPTVAMTVNITNADVDVEQHIQTSDPNMAADEAAKKIHQLFANTGLSFASQLVR